MVDDIPEKVDKDESIITAGGTKKVNKTFSALSLVILKLFIDFVLYYGIFFVPLQVI